MNKKTTLIVQLNESFYITVHKGIIDFITRQWKENGRYVKSGKAKHTNQYAVGLSIWYLLKSESSTDVIQNYRSHLTELAAKCLYCESSLEYWIAWLKKEELLYIKGKHLHLHDYKVLKKYGVNHKELFRKPIYYNPSEKIPFAYKLLTIGIMQMQERGKKMYEKKLAANPSIRQEISNYLFAFRTDANSAFTDLDNFRKAHLKLCIKSYKEKETGHNSDCFYHIHKYADINPDIQLCGATYGKYMGYRVIKKKDAKGKDQSHCMGFSHLKHRLAALGLISIEKRPIESDYRARKDETIYHHRWVKERNKTIWFLPDEIIINHDALFGVKDTI